MKLSTKGRHAITAMMELALRHQQGPVTLADISVEQSISVSYLEQLFARLRKSGLVTGLRGPGGGYCLRRPASEISVAEILAAVDDTVQPSGHQPSLIEENQLPASVQLWRQLSQQIYGFLSDISLAQVTQLGGIPASPESNKAHHPGNGFQRTAA